MLPIKRLLSAAAVSALTVVGLSAAPALAASACNATGDFCVSSITYSPATVSNAVDTPLQVTMQATPGLSELVIDVQPGVFSAQVTKIWMYPDAGHPGTYGNSFTMARGGRTGSFQAIDVDPLNGAGKVSGAALDAAGISRFTVTGTDPADTSAPAVAKLSLSSTAVQDVTLKAASLSVSARITDAGTGATSVALTAVPRTKVVAPSIRNNPAGVSLTLTAGTKNDGTWTGTLPLTAGTSTVWDLNVSSQDFFGNSSTTTASQLAALGSASTITTRTTAKPPAPQGFSVNTVAGGGIPPGPVTARATWTYQPTGQPVATEWLITTSSGCTAAPQLTVLPPTTTVSVTASRKAGAGIVSCTISVRASNGAGVSAASSGSAFLF